MCERCVADMKSLEVEMKLSPTNPVLMKESVNGGGSDITLRDMIALDVFARICEYEYMGTEPNPKNAAKLAYTAADELLAERQRTKQ